MNIFSPLLDIRQCINQDFKPINIEHMTFELDEAPINCVYDGVLRPKSFKG